MYGQGSTQESSVGDRRTSPSPQLGPRNLLAVAYLSGPSTATPSVAGVRLSFLPANAALLCAPPLPPPPPPAPAMTGAVPDGRRPRVPLRDGSGVGGTAAVPIAPPASPQVQSPPLLPFVVPVPPVLWPPPGRGAWATRSPHSSPGVPLPSATSFRQRPCLALVARPAAAHTRRPGVAHWPGPPGHVAGARQDHGGSVDSADGPDDVDDAAGGGSPRTRGNAQAGGHVALTSASYSPGSSLPAGLLDASNRQRGGARALPGTESAAAEVPSSANMSFPPYAVGATFTPTQARIYSDVSKRLARGELEGATDALVAAAADAPLVLVIRVVRQLRQACLLLDALRVITALDSAGRRPEFERRLYSELFVLLARLGRGERLTREWAALDPGTMAHLGALAFRTVLFFFCKQNLLDDAIAVKKAMRAAGYTLARGGYNMFLDACARSRRLPEAFEGLAEMADSGVTPDVVTFNTCLNVCVRTEQLDAAFQLLDKMRAWGVEADNFTWNVLINGCRRQGLLRKAFALADEMEAQSQRVNNGGVTGPDLVTYNTLLAGCARVGDADRAMEVKRRLEAKGFTGNATTYNSLMTACSRSSRLEDAFAIFDEMIARGLKPNREVFCTLINACARAQMVDRAAEVHALMASSGIAPTAVTYNALLNAHRVVGDVDAALGVLEDMQASGAKPDVVSYSAVVDTLGRACRLGDAFALVEDMRAAGVEPNLVTYTSLVAGCVRTGDMPRAEAVFSAITAARLKPNVYTYSALVHGYGRRGKLGRALELLAEMRAAGICPTITTYVALVQSVGRRADEAGLASVLTEMRTDGLLWEAKIGEALVAVKPPFIEAGKPEVAAQVDMVVAALREEGVSGGRTRGGGGGGLHRSRRRRGAGAGCAGR